MCQVDRENCTLRSFTVCAVNRILPRRSNKRRSAGHVAHGTGMTAGNMKEVYHLGDSEAAERTLLKLISQKQGVPQDEARRRILLHTEMNPGSNGPLSLCKRQHAARLQTHMETPARK
jgi:hypothetical protein